MQDNDVIHTSEVNGCSKVKRPGLTNTLRVRTVLSFQARIEVGIITMRIAKIQTRNVHCTSATTARQMNVINATPVTPYVSKPSAVGPTLSPALSPAQSAM